MKVLLSPFILLLIILLPAGAGAVNIEATWDPVTLDVQGGAENISHYVLYWGLTARPGDVVSPGDGRFSYDSQANVGNVTSAQRQGLLGGRTYFFAVAAVDRDGNISDYSAEVSVTLPDIDSGPVDGGPDGGPDGGVDGGPDGGGGGDGGGVISGGCGCSPAGGGTLWALLGLGLLRRRRNP